MDRPYKIIYVNPGQTIFDIAIQEYKVLEGVILIVQANPGLNITDVLLPGRQLIIWTEEAIKLIEEAVKVEPYASSLQTILMSWAQLVVNQNNTQVITQSDIIEIPRLHLYKKDGLLYAKWTSFNKKFLDYNPRIRLFRYSKNAPIKQREEEPLPIYFLRESSVKWRLITRFQTPQEVRKIEWVCPTTSNMPVLIDIDLDEWVATELVPGQNYADSMSISRKRRRRLKIYRTPGAVNYGEISVAFGLGIIIDNPLRVMNPNAVWDPITKIKITAARQRQFVNGDWDWRLFKYISLR